MQPFKPQMKAFVTPRYGGPEVLTIKYLKKPVPLDHEILVRISATTVTSADRRIRSMDVPFGFKWIMRLVFGFSKPKQAILGSELAGIIEAVGKDVHRFGVGDEIFAFCDTSLGCYAEYRCLSEDALIVRKPNQLSFSEATALSFGGTTAIFFLRKAKVQAHTRILINGASGCVGTASVQLAKHLGAHVTAVCRSSSLQLVKSLGADEIIDYTQTDFTQLSAQYDVIMDTIGNLTPKRCKNSLTRSGVLLLLVADLPSMIMAHFHTLFGKIRVLAGPASVQIDDLHYLKQLAETGKFKPVIDRIFSFDDMVEAHRYVDTGRKKGNVIIQVQPSEQK